MILAILLKFESIEKDTYFLMTVACLRRSALTEFDNFEIFNTDACNRQDQSCPWI